MVRSGLWKGSDATETVRPLPDKGRASARIHVPASVFPAIDLRVLLPVYETIVLSPPIAENQDEVLSSLGVAVSDIAELIRRGRVEIALPLSLDRYSPTLLDALSEVSTDVIVGPRELSYWGVVETRKRVPLLFPAIDPLGRAQVLRELRSIAKTSGLTASQAAYVNILAECWSRQEELVDERGPLGLTVCGIGRLVGDLYQQVTGRELLLEFGSAGTSVEVAAVTGAAVCPVSTDGYSEYGHTRIICGVFDGFREQLTQMNFQRVAFALDGLLGVSREVPIVELADALSGPDVSRLRAVLVDIANENVDQTSVEETVRKFNLAIERYAGRKRLAEKVLDMRGLISATVGLIAAKAEEVAAVPAILEGATFLRDRLRALSEEYPSIRPLADAVESSLLGARPRTTLVSRMRSSIAGIRRDAHDKE